MTGGWPDRSERTLVLGPEERVVREFAHESAILRSAGFAGFAALVMLVGGVAAGWLTLPFSAWWIAIGALGIAGAGRVAMERQTVLTTERVIARSPFRVRDMPLTEVAEAHVTVGGIVLVDQAGARLRVSGLADPRAASEALSRQGVTMREAPAVRTWE